MEIKKISKYLLLFILTLALHGAYAQTAGNSEMDGLRKPYHPEANAQADIDSLLLIAQKEHKNIVVQAGGNWCIWCLRFNNYIHEEADIRGLVEKNFVYYHLNYSKENKNEAVFQRYAAGAEKLGYPFFIILNPKGEVIAIRDSGSLEAGKGYDKNKVLAFFSAYLQR